MANRPSEISVVDLHGGPGAEVPVSRVDTSPDVRCDTGPDGRNGRDTDPAEPDPNHHLWRNGRLWWVAFTVHRGHLQERLRFSLRTDDVVVARRRRDKLFALYASAAECRISIRLRPQQGAST